MWQPASALMVGQHLTRHCCSWSQQLGPALAQKLKSAICPQRLLQGGSSKACVCRAYSKAAPAVLIPAGSPLLPAYPAARARPASQGWWGGPPAAPAKASNWSSKGSCPWLEGTRTESWPLRKDWTAVLAMAAAAPACRQCRYSAPVGAPGSGQAVWRQDRTALLAVTSEYGTAVAARVLAGQANAQTKIPQCRWSTCTVIAKEFRGRQRACLSRRASQRHHRQTHRGSQLAQDTKRYRGNFSTPAAATAGEDPLRERAHSLLRVSCSGAKALALGSSRYTSSKRSCSTPAAPAKRLLGPDRLLLGSCITRQCAMYFLGY